MAVPALHGWLRWIIRAPGRPPVLGVSVVSTLALGIGAGAPVLGMIRGGLRHPAPCMDRLLCGGDSIPDWLPGWATGWRSVAQVQGASLRSLLWIVLALSLLLLTAASLNLLMLLLARASVRRPEMAVRVALGADRRRLVRQLLSEGSLLVLLGVALGLVAQSASAHLLHLSWPLDAAPWGGSVFDGAILAEVAGALALTSLLVWLSPARIARHRDLLRFLTTGGRVTAGPGEILVRNTLAIVQIAAALALLASAGLLLRSFASASAEHSRPNFDPRTTLSVGIRLPGGQYADGTRRTRFYEEALRRLATLRGVVDSSVATRGAWVGLGVTDRVAVVCPECFVGVMLRPVSRGTARIHAASPGDFRAVGLAILSGRDFRAEDARVAVVSRAFAYRLVPNGEPLGREVQIGGRGGEWYRIIGVVDDILAHGLGADAVPGPALYLPVLRHPPRSVGLVVRTTDDPLRLAPAIEGVIRNAEPGAALTGAITMEQYLARYRAPLRWFACLLGALAAVVLALASSGLYSVMSYNVARRTREIGIRMALGARDRAVLRMILRQSLRLTWIGVVLGAIAVSGPARLLQLHFDGVDPWDPVLYGALAAILAAVALLASYRPARSAAAVDPRISLRGE